MKKKINKTRTHRNVTLTKLISFHNKINMSINRFNILRININLKTDFTFKNNSFFNCIDSQYIKLIYIPVNLIVKNIYFL